MGKTRAEMTDAERIGIKGSVKQVMQICYKATYHAEGTIQGGIETNMAYQNQNFIKRFNAEGYLIEEFNFHGSYADRHYLNDKRQSEKMIHYNAKNEIVRIHTYIYDGNGNITESICKDADGTLSWIVESKYTDDKRKISDIHYMGEERRVLNSKLYTYDEGKRLLSTIEYDGNGNQKSSYEYKYNEKGLRTEYKITHEDESLKRLNSRQTSRYNEHGDCIEMTYYDAYDAVKSHHNFQYEYDAEGNKILPEDKNKDRLYFLEDGETEEFEYDGRNNWIKKTVYFKERPVCIVTRDIVYTDDTTGKVLVHPLENTTVDKKASKRRFAADELTAEQANYLSQGNSPADQFPLVRYYTMMYKEYPSVTQYTYHYIDVTQLREELEKDFSAIEIYSYRNTDSNSGTRTLRYILSFPANPGYLLFVQNINSYSADEFEIHSGKYVHEYTVQIGQPQLLRPGDTSGYRDEFFEEQMEAYVDSCILYKKPEKPYINIIEVANNNFVMREYPVDDSFQIKDLDINYGYGFLKFHEELLQRFTTSTKGLVLFHGEPGTGKTYYIRHLLRTMVARKKVVIYMPPNMVDHLSEPAFMTFLTQMVKNWSEQGFFCVLLIEDAEPLLARRQEGVRIQGITNLLNISDGILNDMLSLQIICTFNVSVKKLDSALLRPGRLIARKEFKALSVIDANRLAQRLGIKHHFKTPATLGEIYAMQKNANTLLHEVEHNDGSTEPIDDLI